MRPSTPPPSGGRAVIVFIYSGNFQLGNSGNLDGSAFAGYEDVIFVAFNYRTNSEHQLDKHTTHLPNQHSPCIRFPPPSRIPSKQNLGFLDQRLGIDRVRKNIQACGGDPAKIMLFGQSAGAMSVNNHITAMADNPSFRAAMTISGVIWFLNTGFDRQRYRLLGSVALGFELHFLRRHKSPSVLEENSSRSAARRFGDGKMIFYPIVDNVTMIMRPTNAWLEGKFTRYPLSEGRFGRREL